MILIGVVVLTNMIKVLYKVPAVYNRWLRRIKGRFSK